MFCACRYDDTPCINEADGPDGLCSDCRELCAEIPDEPLMSRKEGVNMRFQHEIHDGGILDFGRVHRIELTCNGEVVDHRDIDFRFTETTARLNKPLFIGAEAALEMLEQHRPDDEQRRKVAQEEEKT